MTQFRFLSYLVPRISQMLGWTVDTNSYVDPLLKQDGIPKVKQDVFLQVGKIQRSLYQPPPYIPSNLSKGGS
jgi:hypothetical protein